MRRRIDIGGQLPRAPGRRLLVIAALAVGGLVAVGLTVLILVFALTAVRR
jgi:hypothetical protein